MYYINICGINDKKNKQLSYFNQQQKYMEKLITNNNLNCKI